MSRVTLVLIFLLSLPLSRASAYAQEPGDSIQIILEEINRYRLKHPQEFRTDEDRFKITPTYGLAFTQEVGLLGIGGFNGTYRGTSDDSVPFSNLSVSLAISTKLFIMADIRGEWFSPYVNTRAEKLRIRYDGSVRYMPERFYGIGYECGENGIYGNFRNLYVDVRADILFKLGRFLIGPSIGFDSMKLDKFTGTTYLENHSESYTSFMFGAVLEFDSRDNTSSPSKGVFLKSDNTYRPAFDRTTGFRSTFTADFFAPLWKGGCLAFDLYGDFSSSGSYWMNWGKFGGDSRMRGYYAGRYRDRNNISAQMELRQWFTPMHGAALWGGAGTVFPDFSSLDLSTLLPTYGIGYRLNLKGMIIRLDAGFGSHGQWSLNMGFNQAF